MPATLNDLILVFPDHHAGKRSQQVPCVQAKGTSQFEWAGVGVSFGTEQIIASLSLSHTHTLIVCFSLTIIYVHGLHICYPICEWRQFFFSFFKHSMLLKQALFNHIYRISKLSHSELCHWLWKLLKYFSFFICLNKINIHCMIQPQSWHLPRDILNLQFAFQHL